MRIIELKYYPRLTGSTIRRSCRGGSCYAYKSRSTIGCGATILLTTRDGADCWPTVEDGPPIEAGDGTIWGEGDAPMFVEGVCNPMWSWGRWGWYMWGWYRRGPRSNNRGMQPYGWRLKRWGQHMNRRDRSMVM